MLWVWVKFLKFADMLFIYLKVTSKKMCQITLLYSSLVSVHFLAALNIYFGGNRALSKDVMSEFLHNLSMQTLSISDDSIVLKFDVIKKLNNNINNLINSKIHLQKNGAVFREIQYLDPPTIAGDEPTFRNKIKSIIVNEILNEEMHPTDLDDANDDNKKNWRKIEELQDEQNKQFSAKIEPKLDAYLCDEKHFLMMKMFLVSKIHHQAKNIIECMLKKTKLCKSKRISSRKKQNENDDHIEQTRIIAKKIFIVRNIYFEKDG